MAFYLKKKGMHVCLLASVMSHSFVTLWTVAFQATRPSDFPDKNIWVGCHALLQGIFPTQGSSPHFLHLLYHKQILYPLSHLGSLKRIIQNKEQYYSLFRKPMKRSGETVDLKSFWIIQRHWNYAKRHCLEHIWFMGCD